MAQVLVPVIVTEVADAIVKLEYKSTGGICPECGHAGVASRRLGVLWGRHTQTSCGCRLARKRGHYPCGCNWTQDSD